MIYSAWEKSGSLPPLMGAYMAQIPSLQGK